MMWISTYVLTFALLVATGFGHYFVWDRYSDMGDDESLKSSPHIWMATWSITFPVLVISMSLITLTNNPVPPFVAYLASFAYFATIIWGGVVLGRNYHYLEDNYYYFWILTWCYEAISVAHVVASIIASFANTSKKNGSVV